MEVAMRKAPLVRALPLALCLAAALSCNDDNDGTTSPPIVDQAMDISCSASPTSGRVPLTVRFSADPADAETTSWVFGDGASSNYAESSHVYEVGGTFGPTITILDKGRRGVCRQTVTVEGPPPPPGATPKPNQGPRILTKFEPTDNGPAPLTITVNACPTYDVNDDRLTFRIDFGDRSPVETVCRPVHTWQSKGTYRVNVCASDGKIEVCKNYLVTVT
jgi:PKD repeat protein